VTTLNGRHTSQTWHRERSDFSGTKSAADIPRSEFEISRLLSSSAADMTTMPESWNDSNGFFGGSEEPTSERHGTLSKEAQIS
jgi:hypothetical protein